MPEVSTSEVASTSYKKHFREDMMNDVI